ncbi:MAG: tRNA (adenosine(37)-N6)-dimethylallyltransferase MiaA [Lishizhenia sp.]
MVNKKELIVIGGPTASGKTGLSVAVAKALKAPIISADSRQFYKEVSIGTAKPTLEEQEGIPHYFIHSHQLEDTVSSVRFEKEALILLEKLFFTHNYVVLVGGSGMFIDALLHGTDDLPKDNTIRAKLNEYYKNEGANFLLNQLKRKDPIYFDQVDKNNIPRIIRALEVIAITKKTFSELRTGAKKVRNFNYSMFIINHTREALYARINKRVDIMLEAGLIEEVQSVKHLSHLQSLNTVGYKEIVQFLDGEINLQDAIELVKRNSRRYAKRQITWFKRYKNAQWIDYTDSEKMTLEILEKYPEKNN